MIIYDLTCVHEHSFEGWFQSAEDFEKQQKDQLIACPRCGSTATKRVPSAVHLGKTTSAESSRPNRPDRPKSPATDGVPNALAAYQRLATFLLANCEDVGRGFAEEARKIHYLEAPERSIRGETTAEEFEALQEEGIVVFRLPVIKTGDLH